MRNNEKTWLGTILISMGFVSADDVIKAASLQNQGVNKHIGRILLDYGVITENELKEAIQFQKKIRQSHGTVNRSLSVANEAIKRTRRKSVIEKRNEIIDKGKRAVKKITSGNYSAITDEMLKKNG